MDENKNNVNQNNGGDDELDILVTQKRQAQEDTVVFDAVKIKDTRDPNISKNITASRTPQKTPDKNPLQRKKPVPKKAPESAFYKSGEQPPSDAVIPAAKNISTENNTTRRISSIAGETDAAAAVKQTLPVKNAADPTANAQEKIAGKSKARKTNSAQEGKKTGVVSGLAKAVIYIVCIVAVSVFLSVNAIKFANDVFAFVKDEFEKEVYIPEYATVAEIAAILNEEGLIEYPTIFKIYTSYKDSDKYEFVSGTYNVSSTMNYDQFINTFRKKAKTEIVTLTITEGMTSDEIINLFIENGIGTYEGFINAINNQDYDYEFVRMLDGWAENVGRKYRLEGYLFPDTYDFYTTSSEAQVIQKLLSNFNVKFDEAFYNRCNELSMSVDEIINIASIIEKEARLHTDYEFVSSVFHNRLKNSSSYPMLQSDATIQYSLSKRKTEITAQDLKIDDPYNTYLKKGLPPSAICNPGIETIVAALYPAQSDYYYFVTRSSDGVCLFASNNSQHERNIIEARST